jgi:hypothetical protein
MLMTAVGMYQIHRKLYDDSGNTLPFIGIFENHEDVETGDWGWHRMVRGLASVLGAVTGTKMGAYHNAGKNVWFDEHAATPDGESTDGYDRRPWLANTVSFADRHWLGMPVSEPAMIETTLTTTNVVTNGGFEDDLTGWTVDDGTGASGVSTAESHSGEKCFWIKPDGTGGTASAAYIKQTGVTIPLSTWATLTAWVKGGTNRAARNVSVTVNKPTVEWHLVSEYNLVPGKGSDWIKHAWVFQTSANNTGCVVQFSAGEQEDDTLRSGVGFWGYRAEFENGLVLVNLAQNSDHTFPLPPGTWRRLQGTRRPLYNNGDILGGSCLVPSEDAAFLIRFERGGRVGAWKGKRPWA